MTARPITFEFEGTGTKSVVVQLDGQVYREYTIDFATGSVSTVTHEYVPPTEPTTVPVTEYTEPATEYTEPPVEYTDPNEDNPYGI